MNDLDIIKCLRPALTEYLKKLGESAAWREPIHSAFYNGSRAFGNTLANRLVREVKATKRSAFSNILFPLGSCFRPEYALPEWLGKQNEDSLYAEKNNRIIQMNTAPMRQAENSSDALHDFIESMRRLKQ